MTPEAQATFRADQERKQFVTSAAINIAIQSAAHDATTPPATLAKRAFDIAEALQAEREGRALLPSL